MSTTKSTTKSAVGSKSKKTVSSTKSKGSKTASSTASKEEKVQKQPKPSNPWKTLTEVVREVVKGCSSSAEDTESSMALWEERKEKVFPLLLQPSRKTKVKDPNAPKKWRTSYILFSLENRAVVKRENPDLSPHQIMSELGRLWQEASEEDRERFDRMSKEEKRKYEELVPPSVEEKKTGPKRPLSGYMYFCKDARADVKTDNPEMSPKDITKELGRLWKELSDEEKAPYEESASSDKTRFTREKKSIETIEEEPEVEEVEEEPVKPVVKAKKGKKRA